MGTRISGGAEVARRGKGLVHALSSSETTVIGELKNSFGRQQRLYAELGAVVGKITSRLVLSRGDLSGVRADFHEKQRLISCLEKERTESEPQVLFWKANKVRFADSPEARELDAVLQETEKAIRKFLDGEEQLKTYLEHLARRPS